MKQKYEYRLDDCFYQRRPSVQTIADYVNELCYEYQPRARRELMEQYFARIKARAAPNPDDAWREIEIVDFLNEQKPSVAEALKWADIYRKPLACVRLEGPIDDASIGKALKRLLSPGVVNAECIRVIINSPGGLVRPAVRLFAALEELKKQGSAVIQTFATGECSSAAMFIFMAGTDRGADPECKFLVHRTSGGGPNTHRLFDKIEETIANDAGVDLAEFHRLRDADREFDIVDAVDTGFVTHVGRPPVKHRVEPEPTIEPKDEFRAATSITAVSPGAGPAVWDHIGNDGLVEICATLEGVAKLDQCTTPAEVDALLTELRAA